jgi:hypothetical protein
VVDDLGEYDLAPVDYDPHDVEYTPVASNPFAGELKPYNPSWSERLGAAAQNALNWLGASKGYSQEFGQKARDVAGFVPGVGQALSANDAYRQYYRGVGWTEKAAEHQQEADEVLRQLGQSRPLMNYGGQPALSSQQPYY